VAERNPGTGVTGRCEPRHPDAFRGRVTSLPAKRRTRRHRGRGACPRRDRGTAVPRDRHRARAGPVPASVASMAGAVLNTSEGPVELELFAEDAPRTVENFTNLAGEGFYDGLAFHRVLPEIGRASGRER